MGGKGSGRVAKQKRTNGLNVFADDMALVNRMLKRLNQQVMRIFARGEVPDGCYPTLFATLREELTAVQFRALRLERHVRDEIFQRENDNA